MKKNILSLIFLFCLINSYSQVITKDNWLTHEDIKEIRELFLFTENHIESGEFKEYRKSVMLTGGDMYDTQVFVDENFVIRKIVYSEQTDENTNLSMIYDKEQNLRFAYIASEIFSVNGDVNTNEYRVYFDKNGKIIWKAQSSEGTYMAYGDDIDVSFISSFFDKCPYELYHNQK